MRSNAFALCAALALVVATSLLWPAREAGGQGVVSGPPSCGLPLCVTKTGIAEGTLVALGKTL